MNDLKMPAPVLSPPEYEDDLALWVEHQIALLRERRFEQIDLEHLIEELEGMVGSDRRELRNRIEILLIHLLKCQFQPERKSRRWLPTIAEQRSRIDDLFDQSPSLMRLAERSLNVKYRVAVQRAALETGLPAKTFPASPPYDVAELLDADFLP
ncbi:MAG: DUF29 domain-containing protein [Telluria sp.]